MNPHPTQDQELERMLHRMDPESTPRPQAWRRWLWVVAALAGVVFIWHWCGGSEQRAVLKAAKTLCQSVSKNDLLGDSGLVGTLRSLDTLGSVLDDEVAIEMEGEPEFGLGGTYPQAELKSQISLARQRCQRLELTFSDIRIRGIDPKVATFDASARLVAISDAHQADEVRRITCTLVKKEGRWRFKKFSERPVLDKGGKPH